MLVSKDVAGVVARNLGSGRSKHAGAVSRVVFGNLQTYSVSTCWPGRGWQKETERDLRALFKVLRAV
jgi:hypothetical protein